MFTVTLTNRGPDAASGVRASGALPPGLAFVSVDPGIGSFDLTTATWVVGTVEPGATATLRVRARAIAANASLATIALVAADQFGASGVQGSIAVLPEQSDLGLTIVGDADRPNVGDIVTFTATLSDAGPLYATGVAVAVSPPPGLLSPAWPKIRTLQAEWDLGMADERGQQVSSPIQ
jgi:uncharacterized repeat protein (TIGR01451 family)